VSRQAVRGAGPHEGVAPERLVPAPQRGYESALARIEPRVRLWLSKLVRVWSSSARGRTPGELFCGRRRDQPFRSAGALARRTPPQREGTAHRLARHAL